MIAGPSPLTPKAGATVLPVLVVFGLIFNVRPGLAQFEQRASAPSQAAPQRPASIPYKMTPADLALDCPRLTGRIRVRIRQIRASINDAPTSSLSRGLQAATVPVLGGSSFGIDPRADVASELGQVEAYNKRLNEKNCAAFDLDDVLAPGNRSDPKPVRRTNVPAKGAAPAAAQVPAAR